MASARMNDEVVEVTVATTRSPGSECRTNTTRPSGAWATHPPPPAMSPTSRSSSAPTSRAAGPASVTSRTLRAGISPPRCRLVTGMVTKVVATAFGGPEVLAVIDEEVGEPGAGQVLLEVRAAGTNPIDYKLYGGARGKDPSLLPMSLGLEASGVVLAWRDGADGDGAEGPAGTVHVGDEVIAFHAPGSYAERVLVSASKRWCPSRLRSPSRRGPA